MNMLVYSGNLSNKSLKLEPISRIQGIKPYLYTGEAHEAMLSSSFLLSAYDQIRKTTSMRRIADSETGLFRHHRCPIKVTLEKTLPPPSGLLHQYHVERFKGSP